MRKLTLDLESLAVQSFETTRPGRGRGTVHGRLYEPFGGTVDTVDPVLSPECLHTENLSCDSCPQRGC